MMGGTEAEALRKVVVAEIAFFAFKRVLGGTRRFLSQKAEAMLKVMLYNTFILFLKANAQSQKRYYIYSENIMLQPSLIIKA